MTAQELHNINKQQIKGAFCEYQLQQCDSIAEQQKAAIIALQQAAAELRQAINEKQIITEFYKQNATDWKNEVDRVQLKLNVLQIWKWGAFVGIITSVIFAVSN